MLGNSSCECADPQCPQCHGDCKLPAESTLYRIDMEDETGTLFCPECADDAFASGLFDSDEEAETAESQGWAVTS